MIYKKYKWFVHVLDSFNVSPTAVDFSTIERYTDEWIQQRDRGGLCKISNEVIYSIYVLYIDNFCVYNFKIVVRNHLTTELIPTENIYTVIHSDVHQSASLLEMWNMLVPEDNPRKLD